MFYSYQVPPDFEKEWHTIGETMERYFANNKTAKPQTTVYAKPEIEIDPFVMTAMRVAIVVFVGLMMLSSLCYFIALDREHSLGAHTQGPKLELKNDFFGQPAFAAENQNKQTSPGSSSLPHYQPAFGIPRRFGSQD